MNYNFTNQVRKVLSLARDEAVGLGHDQVGTEHILLGLSRENEGGGESVPIAVLESFSVSPARIRERIEESVRRGTETVATGELPYTSVAKRVLEHAMVESRELRHSYVGTEHLLLGLLREEKGLAAEVLNRLGVSLEAARRQTLALLTQEPYHARQPADGRAQPNPRAKADDAPSQTRLLRILLGLACAVIILAGMRAISGLLNPVLMAGFLALLLQPALNRLRRFGGIAVLLIVLAVVLGGLTLIGFIGVSLSQVAGQVPIYRSQLDAQVAGFSNWLAGYGINLAGYVESALTGPTVARTLLTVSGSVASGFGSLVLTLFIFAFMLAGMWELERRADTEARDHSPLAARFLAFSVTIRGYTWVRTVLGLVAATLNYILLLFLGVDYALLWAMLSFLLSYVPNIGFVLSMIPPMLLALLERGWISALIVFGGYQVINTLIDNVVGPRFIGRQMHISALLSFLSVLFWAWVLGPIGAILSVPLTVLLRDLAFGPADPPDIGPPEPVTPSQMPTI